MIIANKYEIPDKCPEKCSFKGDFVRYGQSAVCASCPIFNCTKFDYNGKEECLVNPEGYREDWAKIWSEWFKGDMANLPELYF